MISGKQKEKLDDHDVWVISSGRLSDLDLNGIGAGINPGTVREYEISDLAWYMLNPSPIEVEKRLVGCKISYLQTTSQRLKEKIKNILPQKAKGFIKDTRPKPEVLSSQEETRKAAMKDVDLQWHFDKIEALLKPYNPITQRLLKLEKDSLSDLVGICEDRGGNRTWLKLKGAVDEKISYMAENIFEDVGVILEKVYVSEGLFEMTGFDFTFYNPQNSYRLVKFIQNGQFKACVLGFNDAIEFWIDDVQLIHFLILLEQSLKINPKLNQAFRLCASGPAMPYRLFFNRQLKIDYSQSYLPEIYRELFHTYGMGPLERDIVMNSLKKLQFGISFKYLVQSDSGDYKMHTSTSVMHDVRALEALKQELPRVYCEISKRACVSDAGSFYLLDSLKGDGDAYGLQ